LSTLPAIIVIAPINVESRKQFIDELKEKNLPFPEIDDEEFWTISLQNKFLQYVEYIQQEQIADSLLEDSTFSEDEKETHLSDWLRLYQNILAQATGLKPDLIDKGHIYEVKSSKKHSDILIPKTDGHSIRIVTEGMTIEQSQRIAEAFRKVVVEKRNASESKLNSMILYVESASDITADFRLDVEGITIFVDLKINKVGDKKLEPEWKFSPPLFHGGGRQNDE
jgi:hypothetical protein